MVCMVDRGVELKEERVRHLEYFIGGEGVICIDLETSLREIYVVSCSEGGIGEERGGGESVIMVSYLAPPPPQLSRKANAEG